MERVEEEWGEVERVDEELSGTYLKGAGLKKRCRTYVNGPS